MKAKDSEYRNYISDNYNDYIADDFNNCCGGATMGADGSIDVVPDKDLGGKAKNLLGSIVVLVGVVVIANWGYAKFIKK